MSAGTRKPRKLRWAGLLFLLWFLIGCGTACAAIWGNRRDIDAENAQLIELEKRLVRPVTWTRTSRASTSTSTPKESASTAAPTTSSSTPTPTASTAGGSAIRVGTEDARDTGTEFPPCEDADAGPCAQLTCDEKARVCAALADAL